MTMLLALAFIFFIGSAVGWVLELIFRRIVHKKWINPGFLLGPYLPIYGFSMCIMTLIYLGIKSIDFQFGDLVAILLMGLAITLLELFGGLFFTKFFGIKLWDYSDRRFNYKGVICPLFSLIWVVVSAIYYYLLADPIMHFVVWFSHHLEFSFFVGYFFAIITVDFVYSTKIIFKIKEFARENKLTIRYEELKVNIKNLAEKNKEKYSFLFPITDNLTVLHEKLKHAFESIQDRVQEDKKEEKVENK